MPPATKTDIANVVIIGGGFSGLMTLHHLVKNGSTGNVYVIIEPDENLGYGLAYGTKNPRHLLNVPANNMSALPDEPDHLIKWLLSENGRKTSVELGVDRAWQGSDYVPRCLYARYLGDIALETHSIAESRGVTLSHLRHKVVDIGRSAAGGLYNLELDDGRSVQGKAIILATGNLPNDTSKASEALTDPWRGDWALPDNGVEAVGIIGTGLTTVDTVISLRRAGFTGKILAASRHGLLPKVHNGAAAVYKDSLSLPEATPGKLLPLMQLFRGEIKNCLSHKISWQGVFDRWRPYTSPVWRKLSTRDRRRFFDRLATLWSVHRHRMAPEIGAFIDKEIGSGGLRIMKGPAQAVFTPEGLYLTAGNERHAVKKVFDCRGPCQDISRSGNRLLLNLYNKGLIQRHETGWGLKISGDMQVLPHGIDGSFLAIGPALVGEHLESIAVPELRQQAQKAASTVRDNSNVLSLQDVFWAMMAIDGSRAYLLGRDNWRKDITNAAGGKIDTLEDFDRELTTEVLRQPKSKGGKWSNPKEWNLWTAVHNGLLLPVLGQVLEAYSRTNVNLAYKEVEEFFSPLPYMVNHTREYQELKAEYHYQGKENDQIKKEWNDRLDGYFGHVDMTASLPEILGHLPDHLRRKVETSSRHRENPKPENDSLVGRMICAYLATKGVSWKKLGMEPRIENYLKPLPDAPAGYEVKPLYARLLDVHVESVPQLIKDLPVSGYGPDTKISLSDFLKLYRWYGTGTVVETVKPDLVGAGHLGFKELSAFCRHMEDRYGLHHHDNAVMTDGIKLFRNTQSLEKMGRLSLVQDIIESTYEDEQRGGEPLRNLAIRLWNDDERAAAWGNTARYVPESRSGLRDFSTFRSDIGDIIFCAGLFEERRNHHARASSLKALALRTKKSENTLEGLGDIIGDKASIINDWVAAWEQDEPDSERTKIARFVQQTFGLAPVKPVPVTIDEINLGLKGSGYAPDKQAYHLKYREAKDTIEVDIPVPKAPSKGIAGYNTATGDGTPVLEIERGNGTKINIPMPARGSYDPFGATGSPHAGEIIGFGCSVHHASLAFVLAELAARGADRAALQKVADKFMEINPGKHHRKILADFQMEQMWTAFNEGKLLSRAEYLQNNPGIRKELLSQPGHEHTRAYLKNPAQEPLAAAATRARLGYGYGDLYPHKTEDAERIGARDSWYVTDADARLKA